MKRILAVLAFSLLFSIGTTKSAHIVEATFSTPAVSVHPGDTLRLHMDEAFYENGQDWTVNTNLPGLRLLSRHDTPQGDHGFAATLSTITYTYQVLYTTSGTHVLLFSLVNSEHPEAATLWPLLVKVVP
ncbi:hypothetical protein [Deinococcus ruber]|uniref:Proteinase inhibitor I42 chagasin domain-containing protein n=1 Tax=Deinococcus ruber TaxID=1848197 RepID=A0A918F750_9DEIO|nr:hypothetical protein [Deinococcus ruber]GGR11644.1 hypothetical protein GCM10008957_25810 [Deinococcus ruber]